MPRIRPREPLLLRVENTVIQGDAARLLLRCPAKEVAGKLDLIGEALERKGNAMMRHADGAFSEQARLGQEIVTAGLDLRRIPDMVEFIAKGKTLYQEDLVFVKGLAKDVASPARRCLSHAADWCADSSDALAQQVAQGSASLEKALRNLKQSDEMVGLLYEISRIAERAQTHLHKQKVASQGKGAA